MPIRLMIAGTSVRAQVESALRAGYRVSALDLFADRDTQLMVEQSSHGKSSVGQLGALTDVERFKQVCVECDAGIVSGGIENRIELLGEIERRIRLLGPDAGGLARLQDSVAIFGRLGREFKGTEVRIPLTLNKVGPEFESKSWLAKKFGSSGGLGVTLVAEPSKEIGENEISSESSELYFQERVTGNSISILYVSRSARQSSASSTEVLGATEQLVGHAECGASPFQYCGSIGPIELERALGCEQRDFTPKQIQERIVQVQAVGEFLAQQFGLRGVWGIDFIVNEQGVWPVDINARLTASAELYESQISLSSRDVETGFKSVIDLHVKACSVSEDDVLELPWDSVLKNQPNLVEGKLILFNRTSESIKVTRELSDALLEQFDIDFFGSSSIGTTVADIPCSDQMIEPRHPILTIRVRCETAEEARIQVRQNAERIYRCF